ncbi:BTAD domain-containing putative transcriptional regulator [Paraburkholderia mimosarum]|uniref:BTAD domain-containing putative transcriptional regulator n=1 Tax=Paraburkholderia mimosarum TaxID=312026 RepID=UPI00041E01FD|nr:BTAD domain-containing putative transcriptional regulator [Paraburkholderia mimosarum]
MHHVEISDHPGQLRLTASTVEYKQPSWNFSLSQAAIGVASPVLPQGVSHANIVWICDSAAVGRICMAEAVIAQQGAADFWCQSHTVAPWRDALILSISPRSIADPRIPASLLPHELVGGAPTWIDLIQQISSKVPNGELSLVIEFDSREQSTHALSEFALDVVERFGKKVKLIILANVGLPDELQPLAVATNGLVVMSAGVGRLNRAQVASAFGVGPESKCARNLLALSDGQVGLLMFLSQYLEQSEDGALAMNQQAMSTRLPRLYFDVKTSLLKGGVYDAILRCAFLPEITGEGAAFVTGYRHCAQAISSICERFSTFCLRSEGGNRFSWNPLFRKFLLEEAIALFSPEHVDELRSRASQLLTAERMLESLFMVNVEAGDWGAARAVICDYAPRLMSDGQNARLRELLEVLPDNVRDADPLLQCWLARSLLNEDLPAACRVFEGVLQRIGYPGEMSDYFDCLGWASIALTLLEGGSNQVVDLLSRLSEVLESHGEELGARSRLLGLSAILLGGGNTDALRERLSHYATELGDLLAKQRFEGEFQLIAAIALLSYDVMTGTVGVGTAMIREVDPLVCEKGYAFPLVAKWRLYMAEGFRSRGDYDSALQLLDSLQEQLSIKGLGNLGASCAWQRLLILVDSGDSRAGQAIEDSAQKARTSDHAQAVIGHKVARVGLLLQQGESAKALHWAHAAMSLAQVHADATMHLYASLAIAHAFLEAGDWVSAMPIVERLLLDVEPAGDGPSQVYLQLLVARLAMERSDHDGMRAALRRVFQLTHALNRFCNVFLSRSTLSFLCTVALEYGIADRDVSTAVLRRGLEPIAERLHERWPWRVRIYTLGAFRVVKDGQAIEFSGKAQRRPLDLLKVLIAHGGKSVDVNIVMSALWPDSQGDAAQKSFDTTLHRLRKLLTEDVVTLTNRCLSLSPKMCWVDIWEFDQLSPIPVHTNGSDGKEGSGRDVNTIIDRVFQLYQGDFLCFEEDQQWIFGPADKVRSKFLRFVRKAGDLLEQQGNWSKATEVYRRGIEVDKLSEDLYRALMESQRRGGSVADALETYRRCRQMLSVVLSIAPSVRTTALYTQLTEQNKM